jgi:hypothetical protein
MKILFRKINKIRDEECFAWTKLYNNVDDMLKELKKHKDCLIGADYKIIIEEIKEMEEK